MRSNLRNITALGAVALIVFGFFQPVEQEVRWLMCLWAAALLLGLSAWLGRATMPRGLHRSVYNLGLVVAIGFVLLSMQLLRQQVIWAGTIYHRVKVDQDSGQITSNVRPVLADQRVIRGNIFDREGMLLASSEVVEGGFARRIYPLPTFFDPSAFGNIIGFFSTRFGQSGLEATYSDYLSGERGSALARLQDNLLGRPQVGNDLHLTFNAHLQAQANALLGGRRGSIVVLDPKTGAVLAMVSAPGFDPNGLSFNYTVDDWEAENTRISQYWEYLNSDAAGQPLLNRPTQGLYPPGSTFKTVTAIAALENPDEGKPNDIHCYNEFRPEQGAPPVVNAVANLSSLTGDPSNLEKVYAYSCNVAFAQYALRLGQNLFERQATLFDFYLPQHAPEKYHEFTDLYTEPSLLYVDPGFLERPAALADTGYGQGQLLVTPLQMAMVAASIANDGLMMSPYLVQRIVRPDDGGKIFERTPRSIRRVMSESTARKMRDNMQAVGEYGFGSVVSDMVPGITVGGKSGTAEHIPGATPHAWFIAIGPIDNPRFAVCVMLESGGEGSGVAAQLAGQVLNAAFDVE
jgi:peptidoglycan glycosyltransferase